MSHDLTPPSSPQSTNPFGEPEPESTNPFEREEAPPSPARAEPRPPSDPFQGLISRCFEQHLNIYIESQDR